MASVRAKLGAVACVTAVAWACAETPARRGEIILAIQTDVALSDSVDRLRVEVSTLGRLAFGNDYDIGPRELKIPATLGIFEGDDPSTPVLIRVIARKGAQLKMLREVTTTVPRERVVTLHIPIRWLCDDSAKEVGVGRYEEKRCPSRAPQEAASRLREWRRRTSRPSSGARCRREKASRTCGCGLEAIAIAPSHSRGLAIDAVEDQRARRRAEHS